jgi:hypothetical protein
MFLSAPIRFLLSIVPLAILVSSFLFPDAVPINTNTILILVFVFLPWLPSLVKSMKVTDVFEVVTTADGKPAQPTTKIEHAARLEAYPARSTRPLPELPDAYASTMVKLVPVEMIAAFLVLQGQVTNLEVSLPRIGSVDLSWLLFLVLLIATPLYLWRAHLIDRSLQLAASTLSFAVWIFAIGGPFMKLPWYSSLWGGLALLIFMAIAPLLLRR